MTAMVIFRDDTCMVWSSSHSPQRVSFAGCILLFIRTWIFSSAAFTDWVFHAVLLLMMHHGSISTILSDASIAR